MNCYFCGKNSPTRSKLQKHLKYVHKVSVASNTDWENKLSRTDFLYIDLARDQLFSKWVHRDLMLFVIPKTIDQMPNE